MVPKLLVLTPRLGRDRRDRPPTPRWSSLTTRTGAETTSFCATTHPRSPPTPRGSSLMHRNCAETTAGARPGSAMVVSFALLCALKLTKFTGKCNDIKTLCVYTMLLIRCHNDLVKPLTTLFGNNVHSCICYLRVFTLSSMSILMTKYFSGQSFFLVPGPSTLKT